VTGHVVLISLWQGEVRQVLFDGDDLPSARSQNRFTPDVIGVELAGSQAVGAPAGSSSFHDIEGIALGFHRMMMVHHRTAAALDNAVFTDGEGKLQRNGIARETAGTEDAWQSRGQEDSDQQGNGRFEPLAAARWPPWQRREAVSRGPKHRNEQQ